MDIRIVFYVIAVTIALYSVMCYKLCSTMARWLMFVITASICIYSGIGIAMIQVNTEYLVHYTVYIMFLLLTMRVILDDSLVLIKNRHKVEYISFDETIERNIPFLRVVACLVLLTLLGNLLYYHHGIASLDPRVYSTENIFIYRSALNSSPIMLFLTMIYNMLFGVFTIYLNILAVQKKKRQGIILLFLWLWLSFGQKGYLGRHELVEFVVFFVCFINICNHGALRITKKHIICLSILFSLSIPFLVALATIRLGGIVRQISYIDAVKILFEQEFCYPKYYDLCVQSAGAIDPIMFLLWIICLPMPRVIFAWKPTVEINDVFTGILTGKANILQKGYSVVLPSVLGEAFLIFGDTLYWVHAIILGCVVGCVFHIFAKSKYLNLWRCYLILTIIGTGRGGTPGVIAPAINNSFLIFLMFVYYKQINSWYRKKSISCEETEG